MGHYAPPGRDSRSAKPFPGTAHHRICCGTVLRPRNPREFTASTRGVIRAKRTVPTADAVS